MTHFYRQPNQIWLNLIIKIKTLRFFCKTQFQLNYAQYTLKRTQILLDGLSFIIDYFGMHSQSRISKQNIVSWCFLYLSGFNCQLKFKYKMGYRTHHGVSNIYICMANCNHFCTSKNQVAGHDNNNSH